mmetsp:Transcript_35004/g.71599  ORF Transcript_35004/g.71599 Transcript_35004/m.71599 type:complete len:542 (-) Transcript_35004:9-1634(-)
MGGSNRGCFMEGRRSISHGTTVRPSVRPRPKHPRSPVPLDYLRPPEQGPFVARNPRYHFVPPVLQSPYNLVAHTLLQHHGPPYGAVGYAESGSVNRTLGIESPGHHPHRQLHVTLRLHVPPHVAKSRVQLSGIRVSQHARYDRVERPLVRRQRVRVGGIEGESEPAILQREAAPLGDEAGSETLEIGIDEGHGVAVGVHDLEADGAARGRRGALRDGPVRIVRVGDAIGDAFVVQEALDARGAGRDRRVRIGDEGPRVAESQSHGFDHGVHGLDLGRSEVLGTLDLADEAPVLQSREAPEGYESRDPLAVGWHLPQLDAAVRRGYRIRERGGVGRQILEGHDAAVPLHRVDYRPAGLSAVEPIPRTLAPQVSQRPRQIRIFVYLSGTGSPLPVHRQRNVLPRFDPSLHESFDPVRPVMGRDRRDRKSDLGERRGGFEQFRQGQSAGTVPAKEVLPSGRRSRHRDDVDRFAELFFRYSAPPAPALDVVVVVALVFVFVVAASAFRSGRPVRSQLPAAAADASGPQDEGASRRRRPRRSPPSQ